jgi:hypothetical protein
MRTVTKATKTFSLDRDILADVKRTKGAVSESERVNRLLRSALDLEKKAALEQEASSFFAAAPTERKERRAFQKATVRALARD